MTYLLYFCFILFHVVPFFLTGYNLTDFDVFVVSVIVIFFHLGIFFGYIRYIASLGKRQKLIRTYCSSSTATTLMFVVFVALRFEWVTEVIKSLMTGHLQELMLSAAINRYEGDQTTSLLTQLGTVVFFLLSIFIGIELSASPSRYRLIGLVVMYALAILFQAADLSRASIILSILLAFCFYTFNRRAILYKLGFKWALSILIVGLLTITLTFIFAQYGRVYQEPDAWSIVGDRAENLFLGSHYAFLSWLDTQSVDDRIPGSGMFAFVLKIAGFSFAQGNYDVIETPMGTTNIFLWYRGAIEDLSLGFVIFPILCGYSIHSLRTYVPWRLEIMMNMFGILLILYPFYSPLYFTVVAVPFIAAVMLLPCQRSPILRNV